MVRKWDYGWIARSLCRRFPWSITSHLYFWGAGANGHVNLLFLAAGQEGQGDSQRGKHYSGETSQGPDYQDEIPRTEWDERVRD